MSDKPRLLALPIEIRLQIYSYLDCDSSPIEYPLAEPHCSQASFMLTCLQLRHELQHDFFSNNVFAIRFSSDGHMRSTRNPTLDEINTITSEFRRVHNLQLHDTDFQYDVPMLKPYGKQRFMGVRPFDACSALNEDLAKIEDLQLHFLHRRLYTVYPMALYQVLRPIELLDILRDYVSKCKEQLKMVLEALVRAKSMKGPWGLKKLIVLDDVPCIRRKRPWLAVAQYTRKDLKRLLADEYWPVLTQAAATLGISIENVKIHLIDFRHSSLFATYQA